MKITAQDVNNILKAYNYHFEMDMLHSEDELKKHEKIEKYFDRRKYLTIKDKNGVVIGRVYSINSLESLPLNKVLLNENEISIILAYFKFFRIPKANVIANKLSTLSGIKLSDVNVDIIRRNSYWPDINNIVSEEFIKDKAIMKKEETVAPLKKNLKIKTKFNERKLMEKAIEVMRQSVSEPRTDGKASPKVGAVIYKPDGSIETAFRGELTYGDHAEYDLLARKNR